MPASSEGEHSLCKKISSVDQRSIPAVPPEFVVWAKINLSYARLQFFGKCHWNRQSAIYWKQTLAIFPLSKKVMTASIT